MKAVHHHRPKLASHRLILLVAIGPVLLTTGCGDPDTAGGCIDLAEKRFNDGKHDSALRLCDKAVELEPDNITAYNMRAIVHQGLGNSKECIADWTKTIELAPDDSTKATMYTLRSYAHQAFGDSLNMAKDRVAAKKLELELEDKQ